MYNTFLKHFFSPPRTLFLLALVGASIFVADTIQATPNVDGFYARRDFFKYQLGAQYIREQLSKNNVSSPLSPDHITQGTQKLQELGDLLGQQYNGHKIRDEQQHKQIQYVIRQGEETYNALERLRHTKPEQFWHYYDAAHTTRIGYGGRLDATGLAILYVGEKHMHPEKFQHIWNQNFLKNITDEYMHRQDPQYGRVDEQGRYSISHDIYQNLARQHFPLPNTKEQADQLHQRFNGRLPYLPDRIHYQFYGF